MLSEHTSSAGIHGLNALAGTAKSGDQPRAVNSSDPLEVYLAEMQASLAAYDNGNDLYDLSATSLAGVAAPKAD